MVYGGGSVKKIGLLDKVLKKLVDFELTEFPGVEANPEYDTLIKGAELAKEKNIDFILAIGGGSVIDGVKFMSGAINYKRKSLGCIETKRGMCFYFCCAVWNNTNIAGNGF